MSSRTKIVPPEALDKYEEFHRYPPTKIGEFAKGFSIPKSMHLAGDAKYVIYRSDKTDPETLKRPRRPIDYIHEHDAGVRCYVLAGDQYAGKETSVPSFVLEADALVCLGRNLGYAFTHDGELVEAEGREPLPELYCTPDGKCLLVIQSKRNVLAMMWGGALGVFARGIDG
jgi:hypothetical protein